MRANELTSERREVFTAFNWRTVHEDAWCARCGRVGRNVLRLPIATTDGRRDASGRDSSGQATWQIRAQLSDGHSECPQQGNDPVGGHESTVGAAAARAVHRRCLGVRQAGDLPGDLCRGWHRLRRWRRSERNSGRKVIGWSWGLVTGPTGGDRRMDARDLRSIGGLTMNRSTLVRKVVWFAVLLLPILALAQTATQSAPKVVVGKQLSA